MEEESCAGGGDARRLETSVFQFIRNEDKRESIRNFIFSQTNIQDEATLLDVAENRDGEALLTLFVDRYKWDLTDSTLLANAILKYRRGTSSFVLSSQHPSSSVNIRYFCPCSQPECSRTRNIESPESAVGEAKCSRRFVVILYDISLISFRKY